LRNYPGFDGTIFMFEDRPDASAKENGFFRIIGMPGTGLLAIRCEGHYLPPEWEKIGIRPSGEGLKLLNTAPYAAYVNHFNTFAPVDVPKDVHAVKRDIELDPGWSFTVTVLGTDGKRLVGARGFDLDGDSSPWSWHGQERTAEFTVLRFDPRRPREILFQHPEKGLIGIAQPPKENGGSVTVRMEPGATIVGQLVDANGKPRAGVNLNVRFRPQKESDWERYSPDSIKTDKEGRFRIEALLPGYAFRLSDDKGELPLGEAPRSGRTKDLGDVRMKRAGE
jgi:hypothetical protein